MDDNGCWSSILVECCKFWIGLWKDELNGLQGLLLLCVTSCVEQKTVRSNCNITSTRGLATNLQIEKSKSVSMNQGRSCLRVCVCDTAQYCTCMSMYGRCSLKANACFVTAQITLPPTQFWSVRFCVLMALVFIGEGSWSKSHRSCVFFMASILVESVKSTRVLKQKAPSRMNHD